MPAKLPCPWTLRRSAKSANLEVRFSHQGQRYEKSTGTSDAREAESRAAQFYAQVLKGEYEAPARLLADGSTRVDEIAALWLTEQKYEEGPWLSYVRHWQAHFSTLGALCRPGAIAEYWRIRLTVVLWQTANKERGPLQDLLDWCYRTHQLSESMVAPPLPLRKKRANRGTPYHKRRRGKATALSAEQAREVVAALPEYSESKRATPFPIRARFELMLETGLRPKILDQLSVPEHYTKGSDTLRISGDIDKNEYARELPLSAAARAALGSVCHAKGLIFGKHDYRPQLKKAAESVLPAHLAVTFTAYDFRHRFATEVAATGDLTGAAYLMGHKQPTTINRYARPERTAAERVLAARSRAIGGAAWGRTKNGHPTAAATNGKDPMLTESTHGDSAQREQTPSPPAPQKTNAPTALTGPTQSCQSPAEPTPQPPTNKPKTAAKAAATAPDSNRRKQILPKTPIGRTSAKKTLIRPESVHTATATAANNGSQSLLVRRRGLEPPRELPH